MSLKGMLPKNSHVLDSFSHCDKIAKKIISGKMGSLALGLRWKRTSWQEPVEEEAAQHTHFRREREMWGRAGRQTEQAQASHLPPILASESSV